MKKYCLALDLKEDEPLINEYKYHHQNVPTEIIDSIKKSGITLLDIYCTGNRLCMVIEADENFSFEQKTAMDADNEKVQDWESLMWKFQKPLPWAKPGQKWIVMENICSISASEQTELCNDVGHGMLATNLTNG